MSCTQQGLGREGAPGGAGSSVGGSLSLSSGCSPPFGLTWTSPSSSRLCLSLSLIQLIFAEALLYQQPVKISLFPKLPLYQQVNRYFPEAQPLGGHISGVGETVGNSTAPLLTGRLLGRLCGGRRAGRSPCTQLTLSNQSSIRHLVGAQLIMVDHQPNNWDTVRRHMLKHLG